MKRTLIKVAVLLFALITCSVCVFGFSHRAFHDPDAWIVHSPTHQPWAVDMVASGFKDLGQDFRVHDLASNPFQPSCVCDTFWLNRHWPEELHWSRDGSVVAVTVGFKGRTGRFYGCAYDFLQHQEFRSGPYFGSALEASEAFTTSIEQLMASRGGVGRVVPVPDLTKSP